MNDISFNRIPSDVKERWKMVRDVIEGDQAVRDGCYLPKLNPSDKSEQNLERNAAYQKRAVFYNVTGRTLEGLLGLAFRKDPRTDLPPKLAHLQKNADGSGNSIYQQSQSVLASVLGVGRHGLFVDMDSSGLPVIKSYRAEDIINWRADGQLRLVVLKEEVEEPNGYGYDAITQYRELILENGKFVCRVYKQGKSGQTVEEMSVTPNSQTRRSFDFIPFQFIGSQNNDSSIDKAPLYDLSHLNIAHFRNSADYEDSVFYVGQAQAFISGLDTDWRDHLEKSGQVYIGSRAAFLLPVGGAMGFAQAGPNTLVKEAMDQKEKQMVALGARLLDPDAVAVTATQNENDRETTTSVLSMCVSNVNEAYQQAIRWCGEYASLKLTDEQALGAYKISQDFTKKRVDPAVLQALVAAWQAGTFAKVDLRSFLRAEGVIPAERTDEEIDADLAQEGPSLGTHGVGDGQGVR